jgi:AcrR family transcriptional regulator
MAKRAAGEREKEARRGEILARADALFKEKSFDEIRMADLAAELGLAKGTLYLYFPSKESLFLALVDKLLGSAFAQLESRLAESGGATVESIAARAAATMAADPVLPRLLADLHPVLEKKLPFEEALAFKRGLAAALASAGESLEHALPALRDGGGFTFLLHFYAQVVGLVSLTDLSPFMRRLAAQPGLEALRLDFESALRNSARALLAGMVEDARARTTENARERPTDSVQGGIA